MIQDVENQGFPVVTSYEQGDSDGLGLDVSQGGSV